MMSLVKLIDKISSWFGGLSAFLVIPLMLVVLYEVTLRKLFNAPTPWTYDVCWMLFAAQFLLGGAFTHLRDGHIRIDIIYTKLSPRAKNLYNLWINIIVILPPMLLLGWTGIEFAREAWITSEKLSTTNWFFPAGPPKTLLPMGFFLLALQCLAEIIRYVDLLRKGSQQ
jgi:TRAP-type mannitol/chloroaromatic compound transport system permease small subunit